MPKTILIVDDEADIFTIEQIRLEKRGIRTWIARFGNERDE